MKQLATQTTLAKQFIWRTHDGEQLAPSAMATSHLFYTVRMIFNHSVPSVHQIPNCKRWTLLGTVTYYREVVRAMLIELADRTDLANWMLLQLVHMRNVATSILRLTLE